MATSKLGFGGPGQRSKYDLQNADAAMNERECELGAPTYAGCQALPEFGQSARWQF